jgi:hypothetical protein
VAFVGGYFLTSLFCSLPEYCLYSTKPHKKTRPRTDPRAGCGIGDGLNEREHVIAVGYALPVALGAFSKGASDLFQIEANKAAFVDLRVDHLVAVEAKDCVAGQSEFFSESICGEYRLHVSRNNAAGLQFPATKNPPGFPDGLPVPFVLAV